MKKSSLGRILSVFLAVVFIFTLSSVTAFAAEKEVLVSSEEYNVTLDGGNAFLCNAVSIEPKVGNKMYMTYTVKSLPTVPRQQGVAGCADAFQGFPYTDGGMMIYGDEGMLLLEGYTFFIEFVVTEEGFDYTVARAKGGTNEYVSLKTVVGEGTADMKHMGIWFDAGVKAELTKVHIYNSKGQDLVPSVKGGAAMRNYTVPFKNATDVPHNYTLTLNEAPAAVTFGNKIKNTTDKMYVEYKVESNKSDICLYGFQLNGGAFGSNTQFVYTSEGAYALPCELLTEGASYWIEFTNTHTATGWDVLVQRTLGGKTEWFKINKTRLGSADDNNNGFSAFYFGEGGGMQVTAKLVNLKIYDANHNNLGVQVNKEAEIVHEGEYESYANCDTVYYCKENDTAIATYSDKTAKISVGNATREGTYAVEDGDVSVMTLKVGTETLTYDFTMTRLTDKDGNIYQAIGSVKVTFVTGIDTEIATQILNPENGYKAAKPDDPTYKNDKFICWVTSDGKEFDFEKTVFESVTLFAKWEDKAGVTYTALEFEAEKEKIDYTPYIAIGATVLIAIISAVALVFIIRRLKK